MSEKWSKFLVVPLIILASATLFFFNQSQEKEQKNEKQKEELVSYQGEIKALKTDLSNAKSSYQSLYEEKNGTANDALLTATKDTFSLVFDYDTSEEKDSVMNRKRAAEAYTSNNALSTLFPENADEITPSVTTKSALENDPEVYVMSSNDSEVKALVLITYSISIAGSEKQLGHMMYQITFNPLENQLTDIKNMGEIQLPN